jgi:DNA-binding transcriptional regulator YiaG
MEFPMPNIMIALKTEIVRLARKEVKAATDPIRKPANTTRLTLADLKRRVAALEKQLKQANAQLAKVPLQEPAPEPASPKNWISGKGVRSMRQKLGLSQDAFAKLVGVSPNCVYQWESKPGMLGLRTATKAALLAARGLTAGEAKAKLEEMGKVKKVRKSQGKKGSMPR